MKYRQAIIVILLSDIFHLDTGNDLNPRFFFMCDGGVSCIGLHVCLTEKVYIQNITVGQRILLFSKKSVKTAQAKSSYSEHFNFVC